MKEVWEAQKKKLTNHCDSHGKETQACCPDDPNQRRDQWERGSGSAPLASRIDLVSLSRMGSLPK